jgi:hypothetical protein
MPCTNKPGWDQIFNKHICYHLPAAFVISSHHKDYVRETMVWMYIIGRYLATVYLTEGRV